MITRIVKGIDGASVATALLWSSTCFAHSRPIDAFEFAMKTERHAGRVIARPFLP